MSFVCGLFGRTRQGWYKQQASLNNEVLREAIILGHVRELRKQMPRVGARKLHYLMFRRASGMEDKKPFSELIYYN